MQFTKDELLEEGKNFIEQGFAGKVKTIVRALCRLSGIRIKERNDLLQFKEICEEDSRDYFRKRKTPYRTCRC